MKKWSNNEAELKKSVAYEKACKWMIANEGVVCLKLFQVESWTVIFLMLKL